MDHKNIAFKILQGASPGGWTWVFEPENTKPIRGHTMTRDAAIARAQQAIDNWLTAKENVNAATRPPQPSLTGSQWK